MQPQFFGVVLIMILTIGFTACFTGIVILIYRTSLLQKRTNQIEQDLEVVKNFIVDRAISSAIIKGIGDMNSPWALRSDKLDWYLVYKDELHKSYHELKKKYSSFGKSLTDTELFWELSARFSRRLSTSICVEKGISAGECILGACYVAKGNLPVDIDINNEQS